MKKLILLLLFLLGFFNSSLFAQFAADGSYIWNSTSITYSVNDKTELVFGNRDQYSNQIKRLDYFHFELVGYRKLSKKFSLGLGLRQTESYKTERWNPGKSYMFYGVYAFNPWDIKIKFTNRLAIKTYKTADTQYSFDNISSIDFFARSTSKIPKPYLTEDLFTNLKLGRVQLMRLYGGLHLLKKEHFSIDLFYCYLKTRPVEEWKNYSIFGLGTKVHI